ncbi:MAG: PEP-CTERM sorting domain-containing protein [Desulfobulbaceae bacterium]|nr:PEP-CTERM sorting domain-containing protein [Desulfobulbaceae bacterium]
MKKTIVVLALSLSLSAVSAQAEIISFNFSGHWTGVSNGLESWFTSGGNFNLGVSYVPGVSATSSAASISMYLSTDDWFGNLAAPGIQILNDFEINGGNESTDQFIISLLPGALTIPSLPSALASLTSIPSFYYGMLNLKDSTAEVFSDSNLPGEIIMTSLPLESMSQSFFLFFGAGNTRVSGHIDSISHPTPEPTTLFLFATGLTALGAYRRRRIN